MDVRKECCHEVLGLLIAEELKRVGLTLKNLFGETHMGHSTYYELKGAPISI